MPCQHPGKVLQQQYLAPQQISQNQLARAIKVPPRRINEIIHGKRGISADTAVRLAIYFGGSASYWLHLQAAHEIEKVKNNISIQLNTLQAAPQVLDDTAKKQNNEKPLKPKNSAKKRIMR